MKKVEYVRVELRTNVRIPEMTNSAAIISCSEVFNLGFDFIK